MKSNNKFKIKIIILVTFICMGSFLLWWSEGLKPVNSKDISKKHFLITKGETLREIAKSLKDHKLIKDQIVFFLVTKMAGMDKNIQAGDFELSPNMDTHSIIEALDHGTEDEWITIVEGLRNEEIYEKLSESLKNIDKNDFLKEASIGYIFPDTYRVPKDIDAQKMITIMKDNFDKQWITLNFDSVTKANLVKNLSKNQIVILASIIEREAQHQDDFPIIAGILLKRLQIGMPLGVDATIQYALGYDNKEKTWWKKNLAQDDLLIDSPYNSRKNVDLPPTPISNPGKFALTSILDYKDSPYWFYLSDKNNVMHYAKTSEEHTQNIRKYLE